MAQECLQLSWRFTPGCRRTVSIYWPIAIADDRRVSDEPEFRVCHYQCTSVMRHRPAIARCGGRPPARIALVLTSATLSAKATGARMARGKVTSRRPVDSRITWPEACYVRGRNETDSHQRRYPANYSNFAPIPSRRMEIQSVISLGRDYGNYLDRVNVSSWRQPHWHLISVVTGYCRQRWPQ